LKVEGVGFGVEGLESGVRGLGVRVWVSGLGVCELENWGVRYGAKGFWCRFQG